jgi:hypothetical protein
MPALPMAVLTAAALIVTANGFPAQAHPELMEDQIEAKKDQIDPQTGKPYFELQPIWLSPTSSVHEDLLKEAFNLSRIHKRTWNPGATASSDEMNYMKGVYWSDSPERGLCVWCSATDANFRVITWYNRFKAAQKAAESGTVFTHGSGLLERSHYGDLSFIHGMATTDGIQAGDTRRRIMIWAEFTFKVATGKISASTKIRDVKVDSFSEVFNALDTEVFDRDIRHLFGDPHDASMVVDVRRIGLGSLLHLIQDSYSPSHVERENHDAEEGRFCRGNIKRFLAYAKQATKKHSAADAWPANLPRDTLKPEARVCDPITAGAAIMTFYARNDFAGADWPEVRKFLESTVFPMDANAADSGPGAGFEK